MILVRILGLCGLAFNMCAMNLQLEKAVILPQEQQKELHRQLMQASKVGNASLIRELLNQGAPLLKKDKVTYVHDEREAVDLFFTYTAFDWAAVYGHTECMDVLLDRLEDATPPASRQVNYNHLKSLKEKRTAIVPLFQRDQRSLAALRTCISNIRRYMSTITVHGFADPEWYVLERIVSRLEQQLSLNLVLSSCLASDDSLRQVLLSAGAEQVTDSPPSDCRIQEHLDRLVSFAVLEGNPELLPALIRKKANVNAETGCGNLTPLQVAAMREEMYMARLLLDAGASVNYVSTTNDCTPLQLACLYRSFRTALLLLESGAQMWETEDHMAPALRNAIDFPSYLKVVLLASIQRYAPTREDAKRALQNIAEVLLFSSALETPKLQTIGQEQEQLLMKENMRDLAVIFLYHFHRNDLLALWREIIEVKSHILCDEMLIAQLNQYIGALLKSDEIKKFACLSLLKRLAQEGDHLYVTNQLAIEEGSVPFLYIYQCLTKNS